jgi:23S rRNA pseudouridine955/2504/2580 synthase
MCTPSSSALFLRCAAPVPSNSHAIIATLAPTDSKAAPKLSVRFVEVSADYEGQRIDNFLLRELKGVPKSHIYRLLRSGEVRVDKGRVQAETKLQAGQQVRIPPVRQSTVEKPAAPPQQFPVVFEDAGLVVIDKPAGIAVHGGSGVSFGVIESLRRARPQAKFLELVHRLDRETSGLLMIAKKRSVLTALQDALRERDTDKRYFALVFGRFEGQQKMVKDSLVKLTNAQGERFVRVAAGGEEGLASKTGFTVKARFEVQGEHFTLLEARLFTGRTHQIRVHLQHLGLPIVGDPKYGDFERNRKLARAKAPQRFERMFLHAHSLSFLNPGTEATQSLSAPLPEACEALLCALKNSHGQKI